MADLYPTALGAPGIYRQPDARLRELGGVRMDVAAFLGVAPRGPAFEPVLDAVGHTARRDERVTRRTRRTVPVLVESFDDYRRRFGGFDGPGLLPYAVAAFFENGGRRAYVARVVPADAAVGASAARTARGTVAGALTGVGPLTLQARSEGTWGNALSAVIGFRYRPLATRALAVASFEIGAEEPVQVGDQLRLTLADGREVFRSVTVLTEGRSRTAGVRIRIGTLSSAAPALPVSVEVVEADLTLEDGADSGRDEVYTGLGLTSQHPRWLGAVLAYESLLVRPDKDWNDDADPGWLESGIEPAPAAAGTPFTGGVDAYDAITPADFFDTSWTPGDEEAGDGVTAFVECEDVALLVVPDLYSPGPLAPRAEAIVSDTSGSPCFIRCRERVSGVTTPAVPEVDLDGLRLDPATDLAVIERWQAALVDFATGQRSFIALLDVPPRLSPRQVLRWRSRFNTAYAAAYHPWLKVARGDDAREALIEVPPSAVAAGIIAQREIAFGVAHGPANELAAEVVDVVQDVPPPVHDELHPEGINVFLRERDGVRLAAARTLSRDPVWRQLSVRRLLTMIRRTLERQMQWAVFEPNDARLRAQIRRLVTAYLRRLFRAGAFRGATEAEAFFVRCDEALNPRTALDAGQVITHIGVAPAEPIEFIVLRLQRDGDGTLTLED